MNHNIFGPTIEVVSGVRELVRGQEQAFLTDFRSLARTQSLLLDIGSIQRIDAAGVAAFVSLYCEACKAGHEFAIANPSRQVTRILAIVGLDSVLVSNEQEETASQERQLKPAAA